MVSAENIVGDIKYTRYGSYPDSPQLRAIGKDNKVFRREAEVSNVLFRGRNRADLQTIGDSQLKEVYRVLTRHYDLKPANLDLENYSLAPSRPQERWLRFNLAGHNARVCVEYPRTFIMEAWNKDISEEQLATVISRPHTQFTNKRLRNTSMYMDRIKELGYRISVGQGSIGMLLPVNLSLLRLPMEQIASMQYSSAGEPRIMVFGGLSTHDFNYGLVRLENYNALMKGLCTQGIATLYPGSPPQVKHILNEREVIALAAAKYTQDSPMVMMRNLVNGLFLKCARFGISLRLP